MGHVVSMFKAVFKTSKPQQVTMIGLDNAGKTTILNFLKYGKTPLATIPTIGFNQETFKVGNVEFNAWDLGGQASIRSLWDYYVEQCAGLVFVVDIMDEARWDLASKELNDHVKNFDNKPVLILANKADGDNYTEHNLKVERLKEKFRLKEWHKNACEIKHVSVLDDKSINPKPEDRLFPAFTWLADNMSGNNK